MSVYTELKSIWKKIRINGQVKNYSNIELWVVENITTGKPVARLLPSGHKTPAQIDVDAFKRIDGKAIQKHKNWWKFYDFSTVDVYNDGRGLKLSVIAKRAVKEDHFGKVKYVRKKWGIPLVAILDIRRNKKNKIIAYYVSKHGWLDLEVTLKMVCHHKIDNARPVFPKKGKPYIRSKRDKSILNNFKVKGRA